MSFSTELSPRFRHTDGPSEPLTMGEVVALGSDPQVDDDRPACVATMPPGTYTLETTPGGEVRVMRQPESKTLDRSRPVTPSDLNRINRDYWKKQAGGQSR